jgi:hypothetical protein
MGESEGGEEDDLDSVRRVHAEWTDLVRDSCAHTSHSGHFVIRGFNIRYGRVFEIAE